MSNVTGASYAGPLEFSLQNVKDNLIDLPKNAMQRLRSEQDGMTDVVSELAQSVPSHGENAGITAKTYQTFVDTTALIAKLSTHEQELEKALEVVRETKAKTIHDRENAVAQIVDAVKSTAQRTGNKEVLASFEKTLHYNSQIAEKAAQTRRKNAEGKGTENPPDGQQSP